MVAAVAAWEQVSLARVGFPRQEERSQILDHRNRAGLEFSLGVGFAEVNRRADSARVCVDIFDHQGTSFGNAAGGVQANSKEGAIAIGLQTIVEQELDFLLAKYLGLPMSLNLHAWCIPDPTLQSLAYLLHYCIGRRGFLNEFAQE